MGRKNTNNFPPINRWLYHIRRGGGQKNNEIKKNSHTLSLTKKP
jgi:hypothetical protein